MLSVFPPDTNAWCCYPLPSSILQLYSLFSSTLYAPKTRNHPPSQSPAALQNFRSPLPFISLYNLVQLNSKMNIFVIIKIFYPLEHATFPLLFYTPVSPFKFLLLDIHNTLKLLTTFSFLLTGDSLPKNPPYSDKTYHISLCLPYSNSLIHPTYIITTLCSTPFIWIQIRFWSFGVSLPKLPLILMGSIVLLLPPSTHTQCPDAIIALLRVF